MKRESNWVDFGVLKILWTREIRDQVYDEKHDMVTITVLCCDPEKLRDKICCKGCGTIKSIEIVETSKPKPPETPEENPPPPLKRKPENPPPAPPPKAVPIIVCCVPCYEGREGGPCFHGYGRPPPCYDAYYGRPVYDSYGGGRPCYVSRCDEYVCEDNTSACSIMWSSSP